ncbi:MAG: hypothetical protein ACKORB_02930, partial [Opitutia bacterium]
MDDKVVTEPPPESRFQVARRTLMADVWMGRLIRAGGVGVIAEVMGMLAFLLWQVVPLFSAAELAPAAPVALRADDVAFGEDESGEVVYAAGPTGRIVFRRVSDGAVVHEWSAPAGSAPVSAVRILSREGQILLGQAEGAQRAAGGARLTNHQEARAGRPGQPDFADRPALLAHLSGRIG